MLRTVYLSCSLLVAIAASRGQCANQWLPGAGLSGINEYVHCSVAWDPDGPGPQATKVVFGGTFFIAGDQLVNNIAVYDPATSTWSSFGSGMNGGVFELAVAANNDLIAAGGFTIAGGVAANRVARWNGTTWTPLGSGLGSDVTALTVLANGDIAAGFSGGVSSWDGTAWSSLGSVGGPVNCLTQLQNGNLVAGGNFHTIGGVPAEDVAQWNGAAWSQLGSGIPGNDLLSIGNAEVLSLCVTTSGDLVVGGTWYSASGTQHVARWNGVTWSAQHNGLAISYQAPFALRQTPSGDLIAGGQLAFAAGGSARVARWDGSTWSPMGPVDSYTWAATTVTPLGGDVYAAGTFEAIGGLRVKRAARWNGVVWNALGSGTSDPVTALSIAPNGDVIAAGRFHTIEGTAATNVARWNGSTWSAMNAPSNGEIATVLALRNGDVLIGGTFPTLATSVARWTGTTWVPYGADWPAYVVTLLELSNGDVAGGGFNGNVPYYQSAATVWNGSNPTVIPNIPGFPGSVGALAELPGGPLVIATNTTLVQWNGTTLQFFASGGGPAYPVISSMVVAPSGRLYVGGRFTQMQGVAASSIAAWDGVAWSPLGAGVSAVVQLALLPDGDLAVAGPTTAGGGPVGGLARWNGTTWSSLGGTFTGAAPSALAMPPSGPLFVGGYFQLTDGVVSPYLARLATTCPATFAPFGAGCPSSGGSNTLAITSPPWVDGTFRALGTGLPTTALVLTVTSVTPIVPGFALTNAFPQAGPGCDLHVAPDILGLLLTTTGTAVSELALPNTPPLVGVTFFHQMVPIELDGLGNWIAVTATNALQLTAGSF